MIDTTYLTAVTAVGALFASMASVGFASRSAREAGRHADAAERAIDHARQAGHGAHISHFNTRFLDLWRDGPQFTNPTWLSNCWHLHATEFYFFDNGWLPRFMYGLWMVDLVDLYRTVPDAWPSHEEYLSHYVANYPDMKRFFTYVAAVAAREFDDEEQRILAVTKHVDEWPTKTAR